MDSDTFRRDILCRHAAAAGVAVGVGTATAHPLDTLTVVTQMLARPGAAMTPRQAFAESSARGGVQGVYRGAALNLVARALSLAPRFGVYRVLSAYQQDGLQGFQRGFPPIFVAGALAGAAESAVSAPLDLLKIRLQASTPLFTTAPISPLSASPSQTAAAGSSFISSPKVPAGLLDSTRLPTASALSGGDAASIASSIADARLPGGNGTVGSSSSQGGNVQLGAARPPSGNSLLGPGQGLGSGPWERNPWCPRPTEPARGTLDAMRRSVAGEGWGCLGRGWRPTLARDSLYGGVFFAGWASLDELVREVEALTKGKDTRQLDRWRPAGPVESTLEAAVAAAVAAAVSHPLDSAKIRTQGTVYPKHVAMEKRLLRMEEGAQWWQRLAGLRSWEYGVHWQGVGLRTLHHGVATALLVGTYHAVLPMLMKAS